MKIPYLDSGVQAGTPHDTHESPAKAIDFNHEFVKHPEATFYARVDTDSMSPVGIQRGDLVVIDRSIDAKQGDIVIVYIDKCFRIGILDFSERDKGHILIRPADPAAAIHILPAVGFMEWGVVIWSIRRRA